MIHLVHAPLTSSTQPHAAHALEISQDSVRDYTQKRSLKKIGSQAKIQAAPMMKRVDKEKLVKEVMQTADMDNLALMLKLQERLTT